MAVPTTGPLSMKGLEKERQYNDYNGLVEPLYAISLISLVTNYNGTYNGTVNLQSPSGPDLSTPHTMSEFYGYDEDYKNESWALVNLYFGDGPDIACCTGSRITVWYDANLGAWYTQLIKTGSTPESGGDAPAGYYTDGSSNTVRLYRGTGTWMAEEICPECGGGVEPPPDKGGIK